MQIFSCYRGWKEACQATRAILTTWRRELSSSFFSACQGAEGNSRHFDRNIRGTCTIVCHLQKLDGPVYTWRFFHLWCASSWTTQNSDHTQEIIGQTHELILEDRISTKSIIDELLGISSERVGSTIHEDLDMRKLSAKWVPKCLNADQKRQRCQSSEQLLDYFGWRDPNDFLLPLVTMEETWLYHYDPETKQKSMEWRHNDSPRPKNSECTNPLENFSPRHFLRSRRHPPNWLSSKGPNYQRVVLIISAGAIEGHFERKTPREGHQGGLVLALQCLGSPGTCNPEENGLPGLPVSWSPNLFSGSGPVGLPPVLWTEKNNWKFAIFRPTRRSLLPRRPGWTDNFLIFFFERLEKVTATC